MIRRALPRLTRHLIGLRAKERAGARQRYVPRLELLEDRLAPAINILHAGGLQFVASAGFTENNGIYEVESGTVRIGYKPFAAESFVALIEADIQGSATPAPFSLDISPSAPSFTLANTMLKLIASGPGIPIWQAPNGATIP